MGQKVNPHGLRVGVIKGWDSRWYARPDKVGDLIVEDYRVREFLKKKLNLAGIPRIEIERDSTRVRVFLHCARPGVVIGRKGSEIDRLREDIERLVNRAGQPAVKVSVKIKEIARTELNAQLVAEGIAEQIVKRVAYRRAMKKAVEACVQAGVYGIKVRCGGRLGGAEIARADGYTVGNLPLQKLKAVIDYGFAEARTTQGSIGVKVWLYRGDLDDQPAGS